MTLLDHLCADSRLSPTAIAAMLKRLLHARAPANSCLLPGAVGPVIAEMAAELELSASPLGASGCLGIAIGDPAAPLDLLISAHMDRPCFRVRELRQGLLTPLCAIRVPGPGYECEAVALRYIDGRVRIAAPGLMRFEAADDGYRISFRAHAGELAWGDTVMMASAPSIEAGMISGAGLDNAIGVLIALLCACSLRRYAPECLAERKIIFAFTDQEEGPPDGLFGQGAARLAHVLPVPRRGFINIDGHNRDEASGHRPGIGASHAFVSGDGRGSVVPMDAQALAEALAGQVNASRRGTVRLNHSYVSRSDDMLLSLWTRCLGLIGVVVENAHTSEERACIADIQSAAIWSAAFIHRLLQA